MKVEYSNFNKGILWKDDNDIYHWSSMKTGEVYIGYNPKDPDEEYDIVETAIGKMPMYSSFKVSYKDFDDNTSSIVILDVKDTILMGSKYAGSWVEVDRKIDNTGNIVYMAKEGIGPIIMIDTTDEIIDLMEILYNIALHGLRYSYIPKSVWNMTLMKGRVNWQGAPINETQELKLKFLGYWNKAPYIDYTNAACIKDLNIAVYAWYDKDNERLYFNRCNSDKFYTVDKE